MHPTIDDLGASVVVVPLFWPGARDGSMSIVSTTPVDVTGFGSAVLVVDTGEHLGGGTFTFDLKLEDAPATGVDAESGNFADFKNDGATVAIAQVSGENNHQAISVNLAGCRGYVAAVPHIVFKGGTSPTIAISASLVLGGGKNIPAVANPAVGWD